jgi:hypothetical protein
MYKRMLKYNIIIQKDMILHKIYISFPISSEQWWAVAHKNVKLCVGNYEYHK